MPGFPIDGHKYKFILNYELAAGNSVSDIEYCYLFAVPVSFIAQIIR